MIAIARPPAKVASDLDLVLLVKAFSTEQIENYLEA